MFVLQGSKALPDLGTWAGMLQKLIDLLLASHCNLDVLCQDHFLWENLLF